MERINIGILLTKSEWSELIFVFHWSPKVTMPNPDEHYAMHAHTMDILLRCASLQQQNLFPKTPICQISIFSSSVFVTYIIILALQEVWDMQLTTNH